MDQTVPTLTLIHLIRAHGLTPPTAPSEPGRLSQEIAMAWKGTLKGLWMNVFLHDWLQLLYDDVLSQEDMDLP